MILEWLTREGGIILSWWALVAVAGLAALPLCLRLLGGLPDRGYTLARAAGILLVAFVYWLLASFGFLRNTTGGMALAWLVVLGVSLVVFFRGPRFELRAWWRENRSLVLVTEVLFFVLLLGWAIVRAHQNGINATEKPMELAFTSAVMRSETFPPNDPWMSGYAISYYFFGYVMAAMLSMLSGVPSTVGFNMMISLLFALTGVTAFGVVYNLVRSRALGLLNRDGGAQRAAPLQINERVSSNIPALMTGLLGTIFVVLLGNYQVPIIEIPFETASAPSSYFEFWDNDQRTQPRFDPVSNLEEWDGWWWFRSARVLNDRYLNGERTEVIDEFPQFSFLLADVHPHVLALPFATLALGLALNALLSGRSPGVGQIVFYSVCLGGLIFLNTWDGPIYAAVLVGAEGVRRLIHNGKGRLSGGDVWSLVKLFVALIVVGVVLYLPFVVNFRSQLGGILPNLVFPTPFQQYFIMFGPLLLILTPFLLVEVWRAGRRMDWGLGLQTGLLIFGLLAAALILMAVIGWLVPGIRAEVLSYIEDNGGWGAVLPLLLSKRISHGFTILFLVGGLALIAGRIFPRLNRKNDASAAHEPRIVTYPAATGFALLLIAAGIVLTLVPEFVYLRDLFGTRMNTVFKLYYQAWLLFSVAGAYAVYSILADTGARVPSTVTKGVYSLIAVVAVGLGLLYPIFGIYFRTSIETFNTSIGAGQPPTLDGGTTLIGNGDDYQAVMCLNELVQGDDVVVVESVGDSYHGENGRTATLTGIPVVFNWPFHQQQWRGGTYSEIAGTRQQDIDLLYNDPTWNTTQQIIDRYGIDYIFFGSSERSAYGAAAEVKFRDRLEVVCERGSSRYYRVGENEIVSVAG